MSLTLLQQEIRMVSMLSIKIATNKRKSYIYGMLTLSVFILLSSLIFVTGCGGGGGSDDSVGVYPEEEEVRVVLDRLSAYINTNDKNNVMSVFYSNMTYFEAPFTPIGHPKVQTKMNNFLDKATQINMEFKNIGINFTSEYSATVRSLLTCTYKDQNGADQQPFSENVQLYLLKDGVWGITDFYKYDESSGETGSNFPPTL